MALGSVALIAAVLVAAALALRSDRTLGLLLAVVAAASLYVGPTTGAGVGAVSWGLDTGFLELRYGELTFGGDDLRRLALLAGAGALAAYLTTRRDHSSSADWSA